MSSRALLSTRRSLAVFCVTMLSGRFLQMAGAFMPRISAQRDIKLISKITGDRSSSRLYSVGGKVYSSTTETRVEGLDASEEFMKLSEKLGTPPVELIKVLEQRLASMEQQPNKSVEKVEYVDWLLSGSTRNKAIDPRVPTKTSSSIKVDPSPTKVHPKKDSPKKSMRDGSKAQSFSTEILFADRTDLHPNSKRAVADMGLISMTEIQNRTFAPASSGRDVLGRARTGTGKTVAFLLPAIERILQLGVLQNPGQIGILVVSPTRELATQIGDQAEKLAKYHRGMSVQVMFGGTNMKRDITRLSQKTPTILVATPGRLLDHLQSTRIGKSQFGKDVMSKTPIVVLDETDRLLDMGFRREISKILGFLPHPLERQTLLFSATIPPELKVVMAQNMNKDFVEVDCINDGDAATHTNAQVQQSHLVIPSDSGRSVSSVVEVVRLALEQYDSPETPAKIVVFFPTARLVNFYSELFNEGRILPFSVMELHSKKSQGYRNRVSDEFRKAKKGVLFTSDVSARGVDYPDVSHVIQFGMPESREQYIHRLGRTGRGGTTGRGWLVLSEWESLFLEELKGVDIPVDEELRDLISNPIRPDSEELMNNVRNRIASNDRVLASSAKGAYQAFLGYYLGQMKRMRMRRKEDLVNVANDFAYLTGLREPPSITKLLVGKMGLRGVEGINISQGQNDGPRGQNQRQGHYDGRRAPVGGGRGGRGGGRRQR